MGLYEFKESDAYEFARFVGIEAKPNGDELFFKICPFCRPKPTRDNIKTFSINLKTGQFNCFRASCMKSGNMVDIAKHFGFSLGKQVDEYLNPQRQFKTYSKPKKPPKPELPVVEYLKKRGISEEVISKYQIGSKKDQDTVISFVFMNEQGGIDFIKYRDTEYPNSKGTNKEWCEEGMKPILYGMYQCNLENKTLIITEGQIDSLSVATAGFENAVSVPTGAMGFTWISYCWDWVHKFQTIIVFGDHEKGQITLLDEMAYRFNTLQVKHIQEEDYKDCKDANEILLKYGKEQIKRCIENAVDIPVKYIKKLSEVKQVDIYSIEKLRTGISELDKMLYGGLPFPGVVIVTGKAGEGKSTLASQMLANAVEQGYSCFAYSGELLDWYFRSWLDFQIAGQKYITQTVDEEGNPKVNLSSVYRNAIANWYDPKMYILDTTAIEKDESKELIEIIEKSIGQYGTRVILLDNLMTALDICYTNGKTDKYERQSRFTKRLARLALQYNVLIILVAHKRKNGYGGSEMDEVMGASDITNLATVAISYGRGKEDSNDSQRVLKLLKNRLFGKINTDGWTLDFEEKSKRIYGNGDDVNRDYGWIKYLPDTEKIDKTDGFIDTDDNPFT